MTTSESKGRFFLLNESILIDSHNESNRFESRIGMLNYIGNENVPKITINDTIIFFLNRSQHFGNFKP